MLPAFGHPVVEPATTARATRRGPVKVATRIPCKLNRRSGFRPPEVVVAPQTSPSSTHDPRNQEKPADRRTPHTPAAPQTHSNHQRFRGTALISVERWIWAKPNTHNLEPQPPCGADQRADAGQPAPIPAALPAVRRSRLHRGPVPLRSAGISTGKSSGKAERGMNCGNRDDERTF